MTRSWPILTALLLTACGNSSAPSGAAGSATGVATTCTGFPWCDTRLSPAQRTALMLDALTLDEKLSLMAGDDPDSAANGDPAVGVSDGVPRLGIRTTFYSDGPLGPREGRATAHPAPILLAATFEPELARITAQAIADEVKHKGNDVVHAPTVDVVRVPLAGRTFETAGEDPYVSSRFAVPWILGAEGEGIIANVKHYTANSQEGAIGAPPLTGLIGSRFLVDAVVDERTLREIYLPPFEASVKEAKVGSVMCAYNYVNGDPACSSRHLLQTILREEWGFDGYVLTDYYFAQKDTANSANNGTDLELPFMNFYSPTSLRAALASGQVTEATIDLRLGNILRTLFRYGFFDREGFVPNDNAIDQARHADIARQVAEQGVVLLKNQGVLPLNAANLSSIAIIGESSDRYVGGGGSSAIIPFALITPRAAITQRAGPGVTVRYHAGDNAASAATTATGADVAFVFVTDNATEGADRPCLSLTCPGSAGQNQDDLIRAVAAANPNTVVVLQTGSAVLTPWRDQVSGLLAAWYPGQSGGLALARLLFGDESPSGRLPITFPQQEGDTPTANDPEKYPGVANRTVYKEGVLVGYRWYDSQSITPAYPFGFGLAYTTFSYSNLRLSGRTVTATVTNTGGRAGSETAQLYLEMPPPGPGIVQPPRQLKGFQKVRLSAGASTDVQFTLDDRALSYYDVQVGDWRIAPGCYRAHVGAHSRQLPLNIAFALGGATCP